MNGNNEAGFLKLNFFVSAVSENEDYSDINLKLPSFVNLVTSKEGLGPVAYFQNFTSETIYSYGCKVPENWDDTDDNDQYPSLNQFNEFNGKAVALRNENENGKCWIFGFPLSFMEPDEVTTLIDRIMLEIE
jgi:hypothetical protein